MAPVEVQHEPLLPTKREMDDMEREERNDMT
jgi:hypothetical protein